MNLSTKQLLLGALLLIGVSFGVYKYAFSSCCSATAATSGCTPSNCRGATTKFGEAQVITDLRLNLIAIKAEMERSESPSFDPASYDIHGIVGASDDESLEIIATQLQIMESDISDKLAYEPSAWMIPDNKAKQVAYLGGRIQDLKQFF